MALPITNTYLWLTRQPGNRFLKQSRDSSVADDSRCAPHCYCIGRLQRRDHFPIPTHRTSTGGGSSGPVRGSRVAQSIGLIGAPLILAGLVCLVAATTPNQGVLAHSGACSASSTSKFTSRRLPQLIETESRSPELRAGGTKPGTGGQWFLSDKPCLPRRICEYSSMDSNKASQCFLPPDAA